MGLYFSPGQCSNCGSRNSEPIGIHEYRCARCGNTWLDTIAEFSKAIDELAQEHAANLKEVAKKFPPYQ